MRLLKELETRSGNSCELCTSKDNLIIHEVLPEPNDSADRCVLVCSNCKTQLDDPEQTEPNYWRCLNDSMWSTTPAVQVVSYRMLHRLRAEGWPQDLLDMLYLDDQTLIWAKAGLSDELDEDTIVHIDSNRTTLQAGDSVVLIKDLKVKGANFIAKRGTTVRRISLVYDNPEHIEGKVNGQQIIILTKFVKKSN